MNSITRLTSKYQTTIPADVRKVLGLTAGDEVEFVVRDGSVSLRKAVRRRREDVLFQLMESKAFSEWDSPEDEEAFRDL